MKFILFLLIVWVSLSRAQQFSTFKRMVTDNKGNLYAVAKSIESRDLLLDNEI